MHRLSFNEQFYTAMPRTNSLSLFHFSWFALHIHHGYCACHVTHYSCDLVSSPDLLYCPTQFTVCVQYQLFLTLLSLERILMYQSDSAVCVCRYLVFSSMCTETKSILRAHTDPMDMLPCFSSKFFIVILRLF
jgi:hypothetical protein